MTIGFDGSRAFSKHKTGTENYSYQLLKALARVDKTNKYLVFLRPGSKIKIEDWPENFSFQEIKLVRFWTQIGLALKTFTEQMDLLFIPSHTLPIIRNSSLKTVITVHDLGAEFLPQMHQIKQRIYLNWITHQQLKTATKIIAVSEATKKDLIQKASIKKEKIKVIHEGVNDFIAKPLPDDTVLNTLSKLKLSKKGYFLFVGTIQPRKNLARLIKAFALFREKYKVLSIKGKGKTNTPIIPNTNTISLVLAGQKGWLSDQIYQLPKKLEIESKVRFLGRVDNQTLKALYQGCLALTFPSLFEGFGLPIVEAMVLKAPVITSNISSMPEVVGDAAILLNPYNEKEIENSMRKIYLDKKLQKKLIQKGSKQVKKFSWTNAAKDTLKLFEEAQNG